MGDARQINDLNYDMVVGRSVASSLSSLQILRKPKQALYFICQMRLLDIKLLCASKIFKPTNSLTFATQ